MRVINIHHVCIQTDKYKESLDFYTKTLGFQLKKETPNFHERDFNTWIELNNFYIELQTPKKNKTNHNLKKEQNGIVHLCFYVKDINEILKKISMTYNKFKLKNNKIIYDVENGKLFKIIAPEGTIIEIRDQLYI